MAGFYKKDINRLLYAPNFVEGGSYRLNASEKDTYTYPVNGWYWFDTELEARTFLGLPIPPSQIIVPNYLKFWDDLIASSVYQVIRQKAVGSLEVTVACTEFVAAIGDAKLGRPNVNAIQTCIYLLLIAGNFSSTEIQEFQDLLDSSNLNYFYTLTLPTP